MIRCCYKYGGIVIENGKINIFFYDGNVIVLMYVMNRLY